MFKIKQTSTKQNDAVFQFTMKRVGLKIKKDEFSTKKEFKQYYRKNFQDLGVVVDFEADDKWSEDSDYFYFQLSDVYKEPLQTFVADVVDGIQFVYYFSKFKLSKPEEIQKFQKDVKSKLE